MKNKKPNTNPHWEETKIKGKAIIKFVPTPGRTIESWKKLKDDHEKNNIQG